MEKQLNVLEERNKSLRVAANLSPVENEQLQLGTGGKAAMSISDIIAGKNPDLKEALSSFDAILRKFEFEKAQMEEIQGAFARNKELYKAIPAIKPCEGELAEHGFGMRYHPILHIVRMHEGVDIITHIGTSVMAAADGVVAYVGIKGGLGNCVEIDHGFGYRTVYGHLSRQIVKEGQRVSRGTQIALTGNSGLSSGPHLHYEVLHDGTNLDPEQFFFNDSNLFSSN
jgi:murein DD-endopeptidase MepM/ murein hydrolase activator NlpD